MSQKKIHRSRTYEFIKESFTYECYGELMAKLFAGIAEREGVPEVASELTELARCDNIHAISYFNILRDAGELHVGFKTGNTSDNIKTMLAVEAIKSDKCAALIKLARDEGMDDIFELVQEMSIAQMTHIHRLHRLINENILW